jgi:protein-S-isoprenylcysteine O-methyltransferase Ste14
MIASALPLGIVVASIAALGFTGNLFSSSPLIITLQVAAVGLNLWARSSFKKGTFRVSAAPSGAAIINAGPYRWIRHPMYAAVLLFIWAAVAGHLSMFTIPVGAGVTVICLARVVVEERLLRAGCPDYPAYARTTKVLVPFIV